MNQSNVAGDSRKVTTITSITLGALVIAELEETGAQKLMAYAAVVQNISPGDVMISMEIIGVERVDPMRCAGSIRFTVEDTSSSAKMTGEPLSLLSLWVVDAFEEQLGRAERVLYACNKSVLRLGKGSPALGG